MVLPAIHCVPDKPLGFLVFSVIVAAFPPPQRCSPPSPPPQPHARGSVSLHAPPQITPRALVAVTVWRGTRWTKRQWGLTTRAGQRSTTLRKVSREPRAAAVPGLQCGTVPLGCGTLRCGSAACCGSGGGAAGCPLLAAGDGAAGKAMAAGRSAG